ncbi:MAG: HEPN domain-containing protein [Nanoarchaeota archaeon]|nr:HEPN domain-containing protein [Nanoarchaeota archaeon]MBU1103478.1 HEPN domain-containing protein [Nanoarchaeota archaeon]
MKKINFLTKLKEEEKLQLVESSEELKQSYIEKSESNLESSKILLDNDKLEESISLTYYSMYHLLTALLFKTGIKCENHSGSIILLKEIFDLNNLEISKAKSERIDKQYYTDFKVTKEEITGAIKNAELFNTNLFDFISKLTNESIKRYRSKLSELIK